MLTNKTIKKLDEGNAANMYLSGMTFNEIIDKLHIGYSQLHQYLKLKNISSRRAKRRNSLRSPAPIGKSFGMWTVISDEVKSGSECKNSSKDRSLYWLVKCKCGNVAWRNSKRLILGGTTRCKNCGNKIAITNLGEVNINAIILSKFNNILHNYKLRKKVSKLPFNITPQYIYELYNKNHYCKLSGIDLSIDLSKTVQQQNISIDRINSDKGYEIGNIQLLDKRINMMKGALNDDDFIKLCCLVAKNYGYSKCS